LILADPPTPVVQVAPAPPARATAAPLPDATPPPGVPPAHVRHAPGDPLEKFNRSMFRIHQKLDRAVLRPAAMGYQHAVPRPVRSGIRHFFSNLNEPVIFANFVLQLKPKSAIRTLVRFLINSTVGVGGLVDVAKSKAVELPHQPNSFGDTLGYYGVKPGPYLFLPLVGPSDFRDFAGAQLDGLALPNIVGDPFDDLDYVVPKAVLTGLDLRAESDADLHALLDDALDPYATLRSVYLQDRAGEIAALKGKGATDVSMPGDLQDPAAEGAKSAPTSASPELQDPLADPAAQPAPPQPKASSAPELKDPLADPATAKPSSDPAPAGGPGAPVQR
jgi:phospholipid-binding lipoprotein MlaA